MRDNDFIEKCSSVSYTHPENRNKKIIDLSDVLTLFHFYSKTNSEKISSLELKNERLEETVKNMEESSTSSEPKKRNLLFLLSFFLILGLLILILWAFLRIPITESYTLKEYDLELSQGNCRIVSAIEHEKNNYELRIYGYKGRTTKHVIVVDELGTIIDKSKVREGYRSIHGMPLMDFEKEEQIIFEYSSKSGFTPNASIETYTAHAWYPKIFGFFYSFFH